MDGPHGLRDIASPCGAQHLEAASGRERCFSLLVGFALGAATALPVLCFRFGERSRVFVASWTLSAILVCVGCALFRRWQRGGRPRASRALPHVVATIWRQKTSTPCVYAGDLETGAQFAARSDETDHVAVLPTKSVSSSMSTSPIGWSFTARQVFDVQWSFIDDTMLRVSGFKRPAGTDPRGGFLRPQVDIDTDTFLLLPSESKEGQYVLQLFDGSGSLKSHLTTFGRIKAINREVVLYSGDGQYGTLITLTKKYSYGWQPLRFKNLTVDPSLDIVLSVLQEQCSLPAEYVVDAAEATPVDDVESPVISKSFSRRRSGSETRRVSFSEKVSSVSVMSLRDLPCELKAEFWWQPVDYAEFLKVRVEIGKAYRAAAKTLCVPILKVTSVGTHSQRAYKAMVEAFPSLKHESRRGLGLGRKKERAKNRDAYIAAVLDEQQKQLENAAPMESWDMMMALAKAGMSISAKDLQYAHFLAQTYYEQDRLPSDEPEPEGLVLRIPSVLHDLPGGLVGSQIAEEIHTPTHFGDSPLFTRQVSPTTHTTKGFGLSRDKLHQAGLSATGNAISRRKFPADNRDNSIALPAAEGSASADGAEFSDVCSSDGWSDADSDATAISALDDVEEDTCKDVSEKLLRLQRRPSTYLNDTLREDVASLANSTAVASSKGFGLSRDALEKAGLSATGHSISKRQRLQRSDTASSDGDDCKESDVNGGESDWEPKELNITSDCSDISVAQ
eukprot:TRINITY_DN45972_c0_g1_i1.p1 TRINITY_DN45972_c0_g1~~TRINITY_DN45972_c0_g1_i1.p1  ORF type:complete len:732 (-),score=118.47 TRINITY_DN45972_c0_g1_i1:83-2278(-)